MIKSEKIFIAGHTGMVGSACWKILKQRGYENLIGLPSDKLDLTNQKATEDFFLKHKPKYVINAAAKVGGILANSIYPYDFLIQNLSIQNNLIYYSLKFNVEKFIFLGSSCIYPKHSPQPIKEEYLLNGPLEETNQWYAIAKISGLKLIESIRIQYKKNFISLMPTNLYGPNDNYDLEKSHVLPAMIRKFHEAKLENNRDVVLWGSGNVFREFLHVEDLANAISFSIENNLNESIYNIGFGEEISIKNLAFLVQKVVGHKGKIIWDKLKPDGTPRKLLDSSKIRKYGWTPKISLKEGIRETYISYLKN